MRLLILLSLTVLFLTSCDDPTATKDKTTVSLNGVFLLNEGQFLQSNGSLSFYDPEADSVQNNIFSAVNDRGLGDVVNDMLIVDSLAFIVVNNSNTIEVMSINTWKSKGTIPAGDYAAPYNIAQAAPGKIYISNLYGNSVSVLSIADLSIEKTIAVGENPEGIAIAGDYAFVANSGFGYGKTVSVIDISKDEVKTTVNVGDNPQAVAVDLTGRVHVLCSGSYKDWSNPDDDTDGAVYVIDAKGLNVLDSLTIAGHPSRLVMDDKGNGYFKNGAVVQYDQRTLKVKNETFIDNGSIYNFNYDPVSERFYGTDAKDFTQNGELLIYDQSGSLLKQFTVGVVPGKTVFNYTEN